MVAMLTGAEQASQHCVFGRAGRVAWGSDGHAGGETGEGGVPASNTVGMIRDVGRD